METRRDRRYTIQTHDEYYFSAGESRNGEQLLMGLHCPYLVAIRFDSGGNLLGTEKREVPFFRGVSPPFNIDDDRIQPLIDAWKKDLQFRPGSIVVKKFFSEEYHIGIEDYPTHFEEILADPAAKPEEIADVRDSMELWDKNGQFVFWWGNDYWLNEAGEVVSS